MPSEIKHFSCVSAALTKPNMSISEEENHRRPSATTGRHSSRSVSVDTSGRRCGFACSRSRNVFVFFFLFSLRRKRNFAAVLHTSSTSEMKGNASSCSAWRTLGVERAKITLFLVTLCLRRRVRTYAYTIVKDSAHRCPCFQHDSSPVSGTGEHDCIQCIAVFQDRAPPGRATKLY